MIITRRHALAGVAALTAASQPLVARAADPEEDQLLAVFRRLSDFHRAVMHDVMRHIAGLPSDPELVRRRGFKPDGVTPLEAVEAGEGRP